VPATVVWDGGAGSLRFEDAGNWSTDRVPGRDDDVIIPALSGNQAVTLGRWYELKSIRADAPLAVRVLDSEYIGKYATGSFTVTSGRSELNGGLRADADWDARWRLVAIGQGTELVVAGPVDYVPGNDPNAYANPWLQLELVAEGGAALNFRPASVGRVNNLYVQASGEGSRVDLSSLGTLTISHRVEFVAILGGHVSAPALNAIVLTQEATLASFRTSNYAEYQQSPFQFVSSGKIDLPALKVIESRQTDDRITTEIKPWGSGSVIAMPALESLRFAHVQYSSTDPSSPAVWQAPNLVQFTDSILDHHAPNRTLALHKLADITNTSVHTTAGYVEMKVAQPIDLARQSRDVQWRSDGGLSAVTIDVPQVRGALAEGLAFRITAQGGGLVTLNSASLVDTADTKKSGGVLLKADTQGVLRMNVDATRGTIVDLPEQGLMAFDRVRDAQFRMIRGFEGGSGKLYGANLERLIVDSYVPNEITVDDGFDTPGRTSIYRAQRLVMPRLEAISGTGNLDTANWSPAVQPAYRTVTWDGGAGTNRWNDAANWSDDRVPGANSTVIVPEFGNIDSIEVDSDVSVRSIDSYEKLRIEAKRAGQPMTFRVTAGASVLREGALLKGALLATRNSGTTLDVRRDVETAWFTPEPGKPLFEASTVNGFTAEAGSWLTVVDVSRFAQGPYDLQLTASGGGSRLVMPLFYEFLNATGPEDNLYTTFGMTAQNGGTVSLPVLQAAESDEIRIDVRDALLVTPAFKNLKNASIQIVDSADDGIRNGEWIAPNLTWLTGSDFSTAGADLVYSFNKLEILHDTNVFVDRSKVYFPKLEKFSFFEYNFPGATPRVHRPAGTPHVWRAEGATALLEIKINAISGVIPGNGTFAVEAAKGALVSIQAPTIDFPGTEISRTGRVTFSASTGATMRIYSTAIAGVRLRSTEGAAIAVDNVVDLQLRMIEQVPGVEPGKIYAAKLTKLSLTDQPTIAPANFGMIIAPNLKIAAGNFETFSNPFPLLESLTGSIVLRHTPGAPVSQKTVFDTPKHGTIRNLTVVMEEGVRWPQLEAQANWSGLALSVYRLNSDGSRTTLSRQDLIGGGGGGVGFKAASASVGASAGADALPKAAPKPVPQAAAKPKAVPAKSAAKPVAKPKAPAKPAAKPVVVKPAPKPKVVPAKPAVKTLVRR
jgi:hypothetical protein